MMTTQCWRVCGVSVIGSAHQGSGVPCQDAHRVSMLSDDRILLVVADGAGSAEHAETGSELAVTALGDYIEQAVDGQEEVTDDACLVAEAFDVARSELVRYADEHDVPLQSLATTLSCLLLGPEGYAAGQVGDGAIVARDCSGELKTLLEPQRGEYANQTQFLISENALEQLLICSGNEPLADATLLTDGMLRLSLRMKDNTPYAEFFEPLWGAVAEIEDREEAERQLVELLDTPRVRERTEDDLTLVVAARAAGRDEERSRPTWKDFVDEDGR